MNDMQHPERDLIFAGNQIWGHCRDCGSFVRINKPLFGSLHLCLTAEELEAKRRYDARTKR